MLHLPLLGNRMLAIKRNTPYFFNPWTNKPIRLLCRKVLDSVTRLIIHHLLTCSSNLSYPRMRLELIDLLLIEPVLLLPVDIEPVLIPVVEPVDELLLLILPELIPEELMDPLDILPEDMVELIVLDMEEVIVDVLPDMGLSVGS